MMNNYQSQDLLNKYKTGRCTDEERAIVESWHIHQIGNSDFMPDAAELDRVGKAIWAALPVQHQEPESKTIPLWIKYTVAASLALIVAAGGMYFFNQQPKQQIAETQAKRFKNDVNPGGNKAMLTLADGTQISLDDVASGKVAQQSGIEIKKTADGQLVYDASQSTNSNQTPQYNTVSTPRGGKYEVNLPDGTRVWLNAESKLKFPSTFTQLKNRKVELSGEAYFEVSKDKTRPFIVASENQEVTVLGTHFNVNAYPKSANKTTLLEGSVKLTKNTKDYLLKPGQQAVAGISVRIQPVDTEEVIAWKNDNFIFVDNDINSIMDILERWYDIEVVYEGKQTPVGFNAEISRDKSLIQVLKALEKTGNVKFKIEGRRVIVM